MPRFFSRDDRLVAHSARVSPGMTLRGVIAAGSEAWHGQQHSAAVSLSGAAALASQAPPHGPPPSQMVWGARKALAIARLWARVMWLALLAYRNPLRAATALRRLHATRARSQRWTAQKYAFSSGRYFWDLYAPGWPSIAFDRYALRELDRVDPILGRPPALQTAIIAITRRCALKCEHCCEWDVLNRGEPNTASDLQEIVRRVQQRGVAQLFFSGGEPLQRFGDLLALTAAVAGETDVWILSSGLGLTADKALRLERAGLTGVALSLDHWDASAHDQFRGVPGSFEAVTRAAANARAAGLLMALSLCPTRGFVSADNLQRYAQTARSLGASFIQIFEPKPVGHYAGRDVALEPAQQRILEQFSERLNRDPAARDLPAVEYMDWSVRTFGCQGAGDRYVYIDTDGALHPCPFCRAPGVQVLDHDIDEAIAMLQVAGCRAGHNRASADTNTASHTRT